MDFEKLAKEFMENLILYYKRRPLCSLQEGHRGQRMILNIIANNSGEISPGHISSLVKISSARTAKVLNNLEDLGYIQRQIDLEDRGKTIICISKKGQTKAEKYKEKMLANIGSMLEYLGPEDSLDFTRIMKKLSEYKIREDGND